jgi:hypothetical protein
MTSTFSHEVIYCEGCDMALDREFDKPCWYQFKVKGHLDESWSEWFEDLTINHGDDDTTELSGKVADQAALYGLLIKMRDLGLTLIAINREEGTSSTGRSFHSKSR